jgi:ATP-binding cassette subfamily B protein
MVGHRTRVAQERSDSWHDAEDEMTEHYLRESNTMDRISLALSCIPRGWLVLALLGLWIPFVSGTASSATMAVSIGGILIAFLALEKLVEGLQSVLSAGIAWKQVADLFRAAAKPEETGSPEFALQNQRQERRTVIDAHDLTFRYRSNGEPVLRGCDLQIRDGERLLLEGSSGGGKSTLASLLTGLRDPQSGLLLLNGLDYKTLGKTGWRRRIVSAPQFHENHVLTGTFAFNLLMGCAWPPTQANLAEAETVCRELGLSHLLSRMPGGLLQMVGETGWQLSHGERSRLFLARTLLQKADLVILDESFAALDPENLEQCLRATFKRVNTLLVIAHP